LYNEKEFSYQNDLNGFLQRKKYEIVDNVQFISKSKCTEWYMNWYKYVTILCKTRQGPIISLTDEIKSKNKMTP